jgi:hypothetical protein
MLPGMTVGGEKEAVAPGGRSVADIVTALLKGLPVGATLIGIATDPPGVTLNGVCGADTVYTGGALLTVRARGEEFEAANPTLPEYTAINE